MRFFAVGEARRFRKGHSRRLTQDVGKVNSTGTSVVLQVKGPIIFLARGYFSRYRVDLNEISGRSNVNNGGRPVLWLYTLQVNPQQ